MRTQLSASLLCAGLVLLGCSKPLPKPEDLTPEQRIVLAKDAGYAAALAWLAIDKPDKATVEAVKSVVVKCIENLKVYETGGFKAALPGIKEGLAKLFPKEEDKAKLLLACKMADVLVSELDKLFDKHPTWKELGSKTAEVVAAFGTGVDEALSQFLK